MLKDYQYEADEAAIRQYAADADWAAAFDALAQPLHEALYEEGRFELLDQLSAMERFILSFDYIQMQVGQGGFVQLIQNGYVSLLVTAIEAAQALHIAPEIAQVLDDALKVFVLNSEALSRQTTVEEFGKLYEEFREFEVLEAIFDQEKAGTLTAIVTAALSDK